VVARRGCIEAVLRRMRKAQRRGEPFAVDAKRSARERAAAERAAVHASQCVADTFAVARERLRVRERPMADRDRLRALQVRVARHRVVSVAFGFRNELLHQLCDRCVDLCADVAQVEAKVRRNLVVA